jgi:hypothetical protein
MLQQAKIEQLRMCIKNQQPKKALFEENCITANKIRMQRLEKDKVVYLLTYQFNINTSPSG